MSRDPLAALIKAAAVADEVVLTVGRDERAQAWPHALLAALRVAGWDITPVQVNPAPQLVNEPPREHLIPTWWRGREWSGLTVCGLPARDGVFTDDPLQATCNVCLANNGLPEVGVEEHGPHAGSWFGRGRWPRCICGYDPHDNAALTQHWAEHGFRVVDEHGTLVKHPLNVHAQPGHKDCGVCGS